MHGAGVAPKHRYEMRLEDGMVYVPAGPFVFGVEQFSNLCVSTLNEAFWIDRFPVTNEQFCRFLNECGNREAGERAGSQWSGVTRIIP